MQSYNQLLTKDEEQAQFLLQAVSDHRSTYPYAVIFCNNSDPTKRTLRI